MKPIAVLGAGNVGQTMAADLTLKGYKVKLYELPEFAKKSLGEVLETGKIELRGDQINFKWFRNEGVAEIDTITTDMGEALDGVELVLLPIPASGHEVFFERMIPHLEDGMVVSLFPDNYGSLMFRKMVGDEVRVIVGGWISAPYGTRMIEPGKIDCMIRAYRFRGDTLPSKDWNEFLKRQKDLPFFLTATLENADTVIAVGLENANPIVHVPGSILNVGAMEVSQREDILGVGKGEWSLYKHGMSPAIVRVIEAYYAEILRIAEAIGIEVIRFRKEQFYHKHTIMREAFIAPFYEVSSIMGIKGPLSVEDRYFTEDIPVGCVTAWRLAKKFGVSVPVIESLITLGSIICQRDFFKEGRSLEDYGIDGLSRDELLKFLRGA